MRGKFEVLALARDDVNGAAREAETEAARDVAEDRTYKRAATGAHSRADDVALDVMLLLNDLAFFNSHVFAARAAGLRIPEDLSVVGYDDLPIAAWTNPALTTVHQPIVEKGRLAARLLIQRMKGKVVESPAPLGTSLVIRGSTSRPKEVSGRTS